MQTLKGPSLHLAQFAGDQAPFPPGGKSGSAHATEPGIVEAGDAGLGQRRLIGGKSSESGVMVVGGVVRIGLPFGIRLGGSPRDGVVGKQVCGRGCGPGRSLVNGHCRSVVATSQARDLDDLESVVGFRESLEIRQQGAATVHATDHIPADGDLALTWRSASEVRVEADQSLDAILRDASPLGKVFE